MPQIEVTFDIDAQRHPQRPAKDLGTGKEQKIRIECSSGLQPTEVERMRKEAEAHADEDKRKRRADRRPQPGRPDDLPDGEAAQGQRRQDRRDRKAPIQAAIETVRQRMAGDDVQAMKQAISDLKLAAQALAPVHARRPGGPVPGPSTDGSAERRRQGQG